MNDETVFNQEQQVQYEVHPSIAADAGIPNPPIITAAQVQEQEQQVLPETRQSYEHQQQDLESEKNFRKLRFEKEKLQRERDEFARLLQEQSARQNYAQPQNNNNIPLADDALVEGKDLKTYYRQQEQQLEELKKIQQQNEKLFQETKLRSEFPDLNKVLSDENIEILATLHPEIAQTIAASPNVYTQGKAAYQMMKTLGIYKEDKYEGDRRRAQENAYKPRPLTSVSPQQGDSPLSHANAFANGLTDELKKQLWKETRQAAAGRL